MVGLAADGETLRLRAGAGRDAFLRHLPDGAAAPQAEICDARRALAARSARRQRDGGWALIVDYGYDAARRPRCRRCAAIAAPASSTSRRDRPQRHVDFDCLRGSGAAPTFGPVAQGDFLRRLGIVQRAATLKGARHRPAARGDRRGSGALDRARPNGHLVPRPGRG
jgi:SAM-dependent MidA family methyltransferase